MSIAFNSLSGLTAPATASDREKLAATAKQFEALFLRQMLAAARKTDFGGDAFGSSALDTFRQVQDEHFADLAAQTGAIGLSSVIEAQMARFLPAGGTAGAAKPSVGES